MDALEKISEQKKCMFVDLFVRVSNTVAITMYKVKRRLFQDKIKLIVFVWGFKVCIITKTIILQALGYAGDLTINGKREDIILTREVEGIRKITHIDLTIK